MVPELASALTCTQSLCVCVRGCITAAPRYLLLKWRVTVYPSVTTNFVSVNCKCVSVRWDVIRAAVSWAGRCVCARLYVVSLRVGVRVCVSGCMADARSDSTVMSDLVSAAVLACECPRTVEKVEWPDSTLGIGSDCACARVHSYTCKGVRACLRACTRATDSL